MLEIIRNKIPKQSWKRVRQLSQLEKNTISKREFVRPWKFCANLRRSTEAVADYCTRGLIRAFFGM